MTATVESLLFSQQQVLDLTGLKIGRLRDWSKDIFPPEYRVDRRPVYSFRDVVGLRLCKTLRDEGVSMQEIRRVDPYLRRYKDSPWASLRIYRLGKTIYVRNPITGEIESTKQPGQRGFDQIIKLAEVVAFITRSVRGLRRRSSKAFGQITRSRSVMSNAPVIAGTRIRVVAIKELIEAGMNVSEIQRRFPALTPADVRAARNYRLPSKKAS